VSVSSDRSLPHAWRLTDRLAKDTVREIVGRFEQDVPKYILTDECQISMTALKDLLKRNEAHRPWQVSDRLTAQDEEALLEAFHAGTRQWRLAERYGISVSSVKRLVRRDRELANEE
jgi:DNA-directed RNA polymerase specialized sigma24 family protein